jgi:hypothetical protein
MLALYQTHSIAGLTVYEDDSNRTLFYVMPDQPGFRIDPQTNKPVLKLIKYLMPVDRPDGSKGGGFLIFDSYFVLTDSKRQQVQSALNDLLKQRGVKGPGGAPAVAQLGSPGFTKGTSSLTLLDTGGALVTKIQSPGKPSLLGSLLCSFTAELSPEGVAVVEGALSGSGGIVQIAYDLHYSATLPPIRGHVWFNAVQCHSFYQKIDKSGGSWDSSDNTENETLRESFTNSQAGGVDFDFSGLDPTDPNSAKVKSDIQNWGWQQIADAAKMVIQDQQQASGGGSQSTSSDSSSGGGSQSGSGSGGSSQGDGIGANRGDDGMKHVTRNESLLETYNFNQWYNEKDAVDFETVQQGTLPNLPNFKDFVSTINANDPFFAQIHATVSVDADFDKFGINSVDVEMKYTKSNPPAIAAIHFTKPDDVAKFDSDTVNGDLEYEYSFSVNYKDQSAPYKSPPIKTTDGHITVDVGTLGILYVEAAVGSVDFAKTPQVQLSIRYPEPDATGSPVSRQFTFDPTKKADSLVAVLLKPVNQPYEFQVTYVMADGTQVVTDWTKQDSQQVYINSPFGTKTISFVSEGDFTNNIDNIFLRMTYNDVTNKYVQSADFTFSDKNRSYDWKFPVLASGQGKVTYSGVVSYKDHTTENIPDTTTSSTLIAFGPPNQAAITVTPDPALIDFTQIRLIQVNFEYSDPANNIDVKQEIVVKPQSVTPSSWTFYARDPNKTAYTYQTTYYLATTPPSVVKQAAASSSDTDLVLMMPTGAAS